MVGLYIHIPFCLKKCAYCDFYSEAGRSSLIPPFLFSLEKEWTLYTKSVGRIGAFVETVYFGGGTPTLVEPEWFGNFLRNMDAFLVNGAGAEITLEANPAALARSALKEYLGAGINRLSLGIQSFDDAVLRLLDRPHSAEQGRETFKLARKAGFDNIGMDLIYAVPRQTLPDWKDALEAAVALSPDHISTYALSWSFSTPLGKQIESGVLPRPGEDEAADMLLWACDRLERAGYEHYEISNFAKPGKRSKHNEGYWTGKPYLGLGPSAHSLIGNKRFWNVYDVEKYIRMLNEDKLPIEDEEMLGPADRKLERLALGLRTKEGVSVSELGIKEQKSKMLIENGLAVLKNGLLSLTSKGMLLADEIAMGLV
jgi:oxygen-independent coproporphyrinogen-3 oxidase